MIDWVGSLLLFLGMCFISGKKRIGFLIGIAGNACWILWALPKGHWSIVVISLMFTIVNMRGWIRWGKQEKTLLLKVREGVGCHGR